MDRLVYCALLLGLLLFSCSPKNAKLLDPSPSNEEVLVLDTIPTEDGPEIFAENALEEEEIEEEEEEIPIYLMASFRRTSCYGQCPTFHIKLFSDGRAYYHGKQNVDRRGHFEAILKPKQIEQFQDLLSFYRFFTFAEQYPEDGQFLPDFPSVITQYQLDDRVHTITNNYDCPKSLVDLEQAVESFFEALDWKRLVRVNQTLPTNH